MKLTASPARFVAVKFMIDGEEGGRVLGRERGGGPGMGDAAASSVR